MSDVNDLEDSQKRGNGRKVLLILAVIFVLPFTIAALLHALDIRPSGKSFGHLITPPVSLTIPAMQDAFGNTFAATNWQKKWNIVMIDRAGCDDACQVKVDLLSRVHISLDKDFKRVQRILLLPTEIKIDVISALQKKFPDLIILSGGDETISKFANKIETSAPPQSIYLVDPLGNLMMQYPQDIKSKELRGDLVRLLKNSWAG